MHGAFLFCSKDDDEDEGECSSGKFGIAGILRFMAYLAIFILFLLLMALCKLCANETQKFRGLRARLQRIDRAIFTMNVDLDLTKDTVRSRKTKPSNFDDMILLF